MRVIDLREKSALSKEALVEIVDGHAVNNCAEGLLY